MTDLEFATCDLEHINDIEQQFYNNNTYRKKFYELQYNDNVYAVYVSMSKLGTIYFKYKFQFKGMEKAYETNTNKTRLYNIYFDDPIINQTNNIQQKRRGIQTDKNRTAVVKHKKIQKKQTLIIIYATTLEECIEKTEVYLNTKIEHKLVWA